MKISDLCSFPYPALDLFRNPEQLQEEMTAEINRLIKKNGK
jgi:hypothetical protein